MDEIDLDRVVVAIQSNYSCDCGSMMYYADWNHGQASAVYCGEKKCPRCFIHYGFPTITLERIDAPITENN